MSNIVLNIVEPSSPTPINPVDPGTGTAVPDTGLFTHGIGGAEAAIIATVSLLIILAIVAAIIYYRKKKQGKLISLKHNKSTAGLAVLALLVSIGTVAGLVKLTTSAIEGDESQSTDDSSALTVGVSSTEFTIELADQPVFAVLPVDITVAEATDLGYTLTAYTEDTNLVSTTDSSKVIPMVTVDTTGIEEANEAEEANEVAVDAVDSSESSDSSTLVPLSPNTYGLSFTDPDSITDEVYTSLSTDSTAPTFITDKDYLATAANDTTTIYYGFYITPDTPYGTYTGSNISVDAIPNIATVTYNANGLYFNDSEEATTNTVGYKPNIAQSPIEEVVGQYLTPAPLTPVDPSTTIHYTFLGWSETEGATTPTYTNEEDILANLTLTKNESLTLYAVWHYDTVLSFDSNTSDGGEAIEQQTIPAGETITLPQNTYTRTGSVFTGWNTAADGSGEAYADEAEFTAPDTSAEITLYAQWAYYTTITFNGNGATSGSMNPQTIVAGTPQNLTKNTFVRTNATFIGWNTQANGSGTSYTDEAEFTASTSEHEDITLYAQWAYTTISFNGNTSDSGTMNSVTIAGGTTSNLPAKAFTKNNCIFTGWNTEANGTGISYGDSTPYTANATTIEAFTLYAQWQCISQVNYYGNGATSGGMASSIILGGSTLTFSQNTYAKDGYIFNGWNTVQNPTAENPGTSYPDQGTFTAPMTPATTLDLYAQWLPTTTITFNGNDATSGSMSDQVIVAGTPQTLTPNAYAKDGYVFTGWNTVQNPTAENPGTIYADKAPYTASTTAAENVTLYAQWKQVFYMQDVATWGSTLSQGDTIEAVDKRDGQEYTVARLADNKIWMTKNLNLAGGTEITSELSNVPENYTLPTANGFRSGNKLPASSTSGFNDKTKAFVYNSTKTSGTDCSQPGCYSYYSWTAATAGSGLSIEADNTDAPYSICPKGWKLPSTRTTDVADWKTESDFYKLAVAYGMDPSSTSQSTANFFNQAGPDTTLNFLLTGHYNYDSFYDGGRFGGYYWSSTSRNSINARYLYFNSSRVNSANSDVRGYGYAVRCIAE